MIRLKQTVLCFCLGIISFTPITAIAGDSDPSGMGWHVEVDPASELRQSLTDAFARAGARIAIDAVGFNITRTGQHEVADTTKQSMIGHWQDAIASTIDAGVGEFRQLSSEEIAKSTSIPLEKWREKMIQSQPYGRRDSAASHFGQKIILMVDEYPKMCDNGSGAMSVLIAGYYPAPGVQSDYGNVTIILMGVGQCSAFNARAIDFLAQVRREVVDDFVKNVDVEN